MKRAVLPVKLAACAAVLLSAGACAGVRSAIPALDRRSAAEIRSDSIAELVARTREAVPATPAEAVPATAEGARIWQMATSSKGMRVLVSTQARALWLMQDTTVLFRASVAVGMEQGFTYNGRRYDFTTPLGRRKVLAKDTMPLWVPPDWHYFELALERGLDVVQLKQGQRYRLADSTHIEIRGDDVGRVNRFGNFWPFTPGAEIIFDGSIYVPPFGTQQRQVPEVLGTHKLVMGDGYLIHGTNNDTSIGDAVSHGCVRMFNADVARLFELVPVGTPVFIF